MPSPPDNPTPFTITRHPQVVILWINLCGYGWAETYPLWPCQHDFALEQGARIAEYRSWLLCRGAEICFAAVRTYLDPVDQQACIDAPIFDIGRWGYCNTPHNAVLFVPRTAGGKWGFRYLHGLEDSEVEDGRWLYHPLASLPGPAGPPPDPLTAAKPDLYRFFLRWIRDNTCKISDAGLDDDSHPLYRLEQWQSITFSKTLSQQLGTAYARASWAGLVYAKSPPMSPCGEAVTALRACYATNVRFYANSDQVDQLLYYWCKPDAAFFAGRNIWFGARADERMASPAAGPGELVAHKSYVFAPGDTWSDPPGDHFCGGVNDFLGLALRTWPDGDDTPLSLLCECDVIVPLPIKFRLSDNSVVQLDTQIATFDVADFTAEEVGPNEFVIHAKCGCQDACDSDCSHWSSDVPVLTPSTLFSLRRSTNDSTLVSGTYVQVNGQLITSPKYSFSGWVKEKPLVGHGPMVGIYDGINNNLVVPGSFLPGSLGIEVNRNETTRIALYTSLTDFPAPADAAWHHYGIAVDLTTSPNPYAEFYLDGVQVFAGQIPFYNSVAVSAPTDPYAGLAFNSGHTFNSHFKVYNTFLSSSEFATLATGAPGATADHWYKMDEGQGLLVHDSGTLPIPGYIASCLPTDGCYPTGQVKYGALIVNGKVVSLGEPITEIYGRILT